MKSPTTQALKGAGAFKGQARHRCVVLGLAVLLHQGTQFGSAFGVESRGDGRSLALDGRQVLHDDDRVEVPALHGQLVVGDALAQDAGQVGRLGEAGGTGTVGTVLLPPTALHPEGDDAGDGGRKNPGNDAGSNGIPVQVTHQFTPLETVLSFVIGLIIGLPIGTALSFGIAVALSSLWDRIIDRNNRRVS